MKQRLRRDIEWDRVLTAACYLYLVVPILIFFFGWLKIPLALITGVSLLFGTFLALKQFEYIHDYGFIGSRFLASSFLIVLAWVFLSGIGGFGFQNWDFLYRNAIFRDLINHHWPVVYDYSADPAMHAIFGNAGALVYYFDFWLPSALVGKVLGWHAANLALFAWTVLGVFLCLLLIARYIGKAKLLLVVAFVFWSGLDFLGAIIINWHGLASAGPLAETSSARTFLGNILGLLLDSSHLETWSTNNFPYNFNYNSFTTQLFWVFNSSVPAWLATVLILNLKEQKSLLFTFILVFFFSPLAGLGLIPLVIYKLLNQDWKAPATKASWLYERLRQLAGSMLSFQNTATVAVMCLILASFYGAQAGHVPHGFIWEFDPLNGTMVLTYLAFIFLEVIAFGLFTLEGGEDRALLLLTIAWLCLMPLYRYGKANDFALKASVPPLIILFSVGFKNILRQLEGPLTIRKQVSRVLLILVFLIGSITPLHEIHRSWNQIVQHGGFVGYFEPARTLGDSAAANDSAYRAKMEDIRNFVIADPANTWFFKTLAPTDR